MGMQEFELIDYIAPVVLGVLFAIAVFLISVAANFLCIKENDDVTQFEKWGMKYNMRAGPHRLSVVRAIAKGPAGGRYVIDDDDL